jgi:hypothetical protein
MSEENSTVVSVSLADLSLEQLVQLSQGLARDEDKIRAQRQYLRQKINERLAMGERTAPAPSEGDAVAPGVVLEASAKVKTKG